MNSDTPKSLPRSPEESAGPDATAGWSFANATARGILGMQHDRPADDRPPRVEERQQSPDRPRPFGRILVAVDESPQASWAADAAAALASSLSARLTLISAIDVGAEYAAEKNLGLPCRGSILARRRRLLETVKSRLPHALALAADLVVRDGPAAREIVAAANDCGADLVVMGAHGRGRLGTFVLGSTAEAVVRRARCPVLLVAHPPGARKAEKAAEIPEAPEAAVAG